MPGHIADYLVHSTFVTEIVQISSSTRMSGHVVHGAHSRIVETVCATAESHDATQLALTDVGIGVVGTSEPGWTDTL